MIKNKFIIIGAVIILIIVFAVLYLDSKNSIFILQNSDNHILGNPEAKNILVEFSDFECPACGEAYKELKKIEEKYKDNLEIIYKHYPLPAHSNAYLAAEASECASDQGQFWPYHDLLFENQQNLTRNDLLNYARSLNLDLARFTQCLDSQAARSIISQQIKEGNDLKLKGTPTFFLDGMEIEDWQNLDKILEEKLTP